MATTCKHKWEPYIRHLKQYRCRYCDVFGYADQAMGLCYDNKDTGKVVEYTCYKDNCKSVATVAHDKHKFCAKHAPKTRKDPETEEYFRVAAREEMRANNATEEAFARLKADRHEYSSNR